MPPAHRARQVNVDEFNALYDDNARDLLGYLLRRTPNAEDAADCLGETFMIAWDKRNTLPSRAEQVRPWLFGLARNVVKRGRERQSRAGTATAELERELHGKQRPVSDDDPVGEALRQLSPMDREIIEMLAWDQLAPREVATILGLSPNAVRVRAHRARLKLREQLRDHRPITHKA